MPPPASGSPKTPARARHSQRRRKSFSKLGSRRKKYYKFTELPQDEPYANTEAEYWYEEGSKEITFIDPVEHCDYESSDEDGEDQLQQFIRLGIATVQQPAKI